MIRNVHSSASASRWLVCPSTFSGDEPVRGKKTLALHGMGKNLFHGAFQSRHQRPNECAALRVSPADGGTRTHWRRLRLYAVARAYRSAYGGAGAKHRNRGRNFDGKSSRAGGAAGAGRRGRGRGADLWFACRRGALPRRAPAAFAPAV